MRLIAAAPTLTAAERTGSQESPTPKSPVTQPMSPTTARPTPADTASISDGRRPFPRKEMIWAQWGLKDRLLADPDVWLCYQCGDCSTHCPRGARPGDVMAAIRRESVEHYAVPRFLGRWMSRAKFLPLVVLIPVVLLGLAFLVRWPLGAASEKKIVYAYKMKPCTPQEAAMSM